MDREMLKPVSVFIEFDPVMEAITGQTKIKIMMSENAPFVFLLHSIFTSYPEIQKRYPPGRLAMALNGHPPTEYELLREGDKITFSI
ncbi:MAG: hypothetical protein WAP55_00590 [Minisyncoccia bacterium]